MADSGYSPRTWGCTVHKAGNERVEALFPTHVGVYRRSSEPLRGRAAIPHARGGVPSGCLAAIAAIPYSPRTWGCTGGHRQRQVGDMLFPTHVGVYRECRGDYRNSRPIPHARGGVPRRVLGVDRDLVYSPRTWGCTEGRDPTLPRLCLFPTHVGVYRAVDGPRVGDRAIPHARGGVPMRAGTEHHAVGYSPRTWGCTDQRHDAPRIRHLFPTHVGVYRTPRRGAWDRSAIPHARGGVPL